MIPTKERAAAASPAQRAFKLFVEHEAPTQRKLGVARDRLTECRNLADSERVWEAVDRREETAAKTYGVPDVHQARVEGTPAATATPTNRMQPEDRSIETESRHPPCRDAKIDDTTTGPFGEIGRSMARRTGGRCPPRSRAASRSHGAPSPEQLTGRAKRHRVEA